MLIEPQVKYDLEELTHCPICGGKTIPKFIHIETLDGIRSAISNCLHCGQLFLNPRMTDEQTTRYYMGDYRNRVSDSDTGIEESNLTRQGWRAEVQIKAIVQTARKMDSMLEIGCSAGYLMREVAAYGAECVGIEADVRYHKLEPASRFELHADISELKPRPFDIIALSHVLEHFNHPLQYMEDLIAKFVHDDTVIMIEVPNSECNHGTFQIHHPFCFTMFTLNNLFHHLGYRPIFAVYHGLDTQIPLYILNVYAKR
jgi:SAM-dependent methyltransferase